MIKKYLENRKIKREDIIKNKLLSFGGTFHKKSETIWYVTYENPLVIKKIKSSFFHRIKMALNEFILGIPSLSELADKEKLVKTIIYNSEEPKTLLIVYKSPYSTPEGPAFAPLFPQFVSTNSEEINKKLYSRVEINDIDNSRRD